MANEVKLVNANPNNAHNRYQNGTADTVSFRDLAPTGSNSPQTSREFLEPVLGLS